MSTFINLVHVDTLSCESILRKAPDGHLIIISQVKGLSEPCKENRVYIFESFDCGKTWTKGRDIFTDEKRAIYATEVTVIENEICVYVTAHNGKFLKHECYVLVSLDNGKTFYKRKGIYPKDDFVFIRGMLRVDEKTIYLPYQAYEISTSEQDELEKQDKFIWNGNTRYVKNGILVSYDNGKSFECKPPILVDLYKSDGTKLWQWTEPTLCIGNQNELIMLLRINKTGFLYKTVSCDNGESYSDIIKTNIKNPGNKAKLIQNGKDIILLNTPNSGSTYADRNPLTISISNDGLQTFYYEKVLVDYPGYLSYPDGIVSGDKVLFAYEFNRHDIYFIKHKIEI